MFAIIGLGNPGRKYESTPHNAGFATIDILCQRHRGRLRGKAQLLAQIGSTEIEEQQVLLAKPMTYMNNSGLAISALVEEFQIPLRDMLIITDDVNLPLGKIRLRRKGTDGGHKGLSSIIQALGTIEFARLRIGVGSRKEPDDLVSFVLGRFKRKEKELFKQVVEIAAEAAECWVLDGIQKAMNKFNPLEIGEGGD